MKEANEESMGQVIKIDEARLRDHLGKMARGTVEKKLNAMLVNAGQKTDLAPLRRL
jgi:putative transposase